MTNEFALQLADLRLLQTLRLLEISMHEHPDQVSVSGALNGIGTVRDFITNLASNLPGGSFPNPPLNAGHRPAAA